MGHRRQGTTGLYTHLFREAFEGVEEALDAALVGNAAATNGCDLPAHADTAGGAIGRRSPAQSGV
jgi:hypothetical protein